MKSIYNSLSFRLQAVAIFLSVVGVAFGIKSYVHIRHVFGEEASSVFLHDLELQLVIAVLLNVVVAAVLYRIATKPIRYLGMAMRALTENKLETAIPYTQDSTEIGSMARKVKIFKENAIEKRRLEQEQVLAEARQKKEKKEAMEKLAQEFESQVQSITDSLSVTAKQFLTTANSLASLMHNASMKASQVGKSAQSALENVQSVTQSTGALSKSTSHISGTVADSSKIVENAVARTEEADGAAHHLAEESVAIGKVVDLIHNITEQIDLLALNATIEAARAGEAGKGFTIVASQVKTLAYQTSQATNEIIDKINGVQTASDNVLRSLADIKKAIQSVQDYAGNITTSVGQQSNSTAEIAHNMSKVSEITRDITNDVASVSQDVGDANESASRVSDAAKKLSEHTEKLNMQVRQFLRGLTSPSESGA